VSIVLNARAGAERIPAVTRERILAAARDLNYRPSVLAQSLRRGKAFAIGVLVPDLASAGRALAQPIADTLRMAGYDVLLATHHGSPLGVAAPRRSAPSSSTAPVSTTAVPRTLRPWSPGTSGGCTCR
jgi:LacI family transcriptional regulator